MANFFSFLNPVLWKRVASTLLRGIRNPERVEDQDSVIKQLIKEYAPTIPHLPETLNAQAILWAIYHCERYDTNNRVPRFEPAYAPDGFYYKNNLEVQRHWAKWGREAACSYSNFQIMFPTACELGYTGPPAALDFDKIAIPFVCKYVHRRIIDKGATAPEQVADAYNSGSYQDSIKPEKYIAKFRRYYDRALELEWKDTIKTSGDSSTEVTSSPEG